MACTTCSALPFPRTEPVCFRGKNIMRLPASDADALLAAWAREESHDTEFGRRTAVAPRARHSRGTGQLPVQRVATAIARCRDTVRAACAGRGRQDGSTSPAPPVHLHL